MSHNILLTGRNKALKKFLFQQKDDRYKYLSSTMDPVDLDNHIELIKPVAIVCCLSNETDESVITMNNIRDSLPEKKITLIVVGTKDECSYFQRGFSYAADVVITKPVTDEEILKQIDAHLKIHLAIKENVQQAAVITNKKHILAVDDDPLMLKIIKEHLHEKYNVGLSNKGLTALKFLENNTTDLILLDYEMPDMNGVEVLSSLRQNRKTANIPVVFLTGTKDYEKVKSVLMLKPQGYILKPIEKDNLINVISSIIG